VFSALFAPFAVFFQCNFPFNFFLVFPRPVIVSFTFSALQFY